MGARVGFDFENPGEPGLTECCTTSDDVSCETRAGFRFLAPAEILYRPDQPEFTPGRPGLASASLLGAHMNTGNSFGFVLLGAVMTLCPWLLPQGFPPTGFDGTSTRALWLEVMGAVQIGLGAGWLLQVWLSRLADNLATFSMPTMDRSSLPERMEPASA